MPAWGTLYDLCWPRTLHLVDHKLDERLRRRKHPLVHHVVAVDHVALMDLEAATGFLEDSKGLVAWPCVN